MKSTNPTLPDSHHTPATSRALIGAVIVVSVLLVIGIGILVSLLRGRMIEASTDQQSVSRPTNTAPAQPEVERGDGTSDGSLVAAAPDAGPSQGSHRGADAEAAVGDGDINESSPVTYDFGAPQPEGELATVLATLTDRVRSCTELAEGYTPTTVSVHLIRSARSRVRVSAIEPLPPPVVGTCISRLVHQTTSSTVATGSHVVQMYELR